jgi:hypothetical protein
MAATARHSGIGHLICMVEGSGDPSAVQDNITRFGAEVLPLLPGRATTPADPGTAGGPTPASC